MTRIGDVRYQLYSNTLRGWGLSKMGERDIITFKNLHYAEGEGQGTEDRYMELDLDLDREGERGGEDIFFCFEKSARTNRIEPRNAQVVRLRLRLLCQRTSVKGIGM